MQLEESVFCEGKEGKNVSEMTKQIPEIHGNVLKRQGKTGVCQHGMLCHIDNPCAMQTHSCYQQRNLTCMSIILMSQWHI
jgi:hypothetical protein